MPENFFGMASVGESLFWVGTFLVIVVIGIIWHLRAKKRLKERSRP